MSEHVIPVILDCYLKGGSVKKSVSFFCRPYGSNPMHIDTYRHFLVEMFKEERMAEKLLFCPYLDSIDKIVIHAGRNGILSVARSMIKSLQYGEAVEYERVIR